MKKITLRGDNPCSEKWEDLKQNEKGGFCDVCSKTVIDFTVLSQEEILETIKSARGSICARITQDQLRAPLFENESQHASKIPYAKLAASVMVATALVGTQPLCAATQQVERQTIHTGWHGEKTLKEGQGAPQNKARPNDFVYFKGKVVSEESGKPIENAKIVFVTIEKLLETRTLADGTFSLEIPSSLVDNENVVRAIYNEVKNSDARKAPYGYETKDFVLSKKDLAENYIIRAKSRIPYLGGISVYDGSRKEPIVIDNGVEINFRDFIDAKYGKKSSCNLENKDYYYFDSRAAIALYGKEAEVGLYLLLNKSEK